MFLSTHQNKKEKKNGRQRKRKIKKNELNKIVFLNPNETPKENSKETPK